MNLSNFDVINGRYKIFADRALRSVATEQLVKQCVEHELALPDPKVEYCLVAGHVAPGSRDRLEARFNDEGWILLAEPWIAGNLTAMTKDAYEDDVAMIVAKLFQSL